MHVTSHFINTYSVARGWQCLFPATNLQFHYRRECSVYKHIWSHTDICPSIVSSGSLTRYVKLWVAHALGMPRTFSPPPTSKETELAILQCITARRVAGKMFPPFPVHAQPTILRIWREAHRDKNISVMAVPHTPLGHYNLDVFNYMYCCIHIRVPTHVSHRSPTL